MILTSIFFFIIEKIKDKGNHGFLSDDRVQRISSLPYKITDGCTEGYTPKKAYNNVSDTTEVVMVIGKESKADELKKRKRGADDCLKNRKRKRK